MLLVTGGLTTIYIYKSGIETGKIRFASPILDSISLTIPNKSNLSQVFKLLDKYCESYNIKSINSTNNTETRVIFNVNIQTHADLDSLLNEIKANDIYKDIAFYNSPQY